MSSLVVNGRAILRGSAAERGPAAGVRAIHASCRSARAAVASAAAGGARRCSSCSGWWTWSSARWSWCRCSSSRRWSSSPPRRGGRDGGEHDGCARVAVVSGAWNDALGTSRWWVGVLVVTVGGAAATAAAATRSRLQRDAERLELLVELGAAGRGGATVDETAALLGEMLVPAVADACVIERPPTRTPGRRAGRGPSMPVEGALDAASTRRRSSIRSDDGLGLRSSLDVPLHARGRTIGTLRMALGPSGRRFGRRDQRFAEVLADGIALALENAGLSAGLEDAERRFRAIVDGMIDGVTVCAGRTAGSSTPTTPPSTCCASTRTTRCAACSRGRRWTSSRCTARTGGGSCSTSFPACGRGICRRDPEPMIVRNVVRETGEQRWLLIKAIAIRDGDGGAPLYVVSFTEDVTAVKRVELAQRVLAEAGRVLVSSLDYERHAASGGAARRARAGGLVRDRPAGARRVRRAGRGRPRRPRPRRGRAAAARALPDAPGRPRRHGRGHARRPPVLPRRRDARRGARRLRDRRRAPRAPARRSASTRS